ncbi:MAG: His Kinase (phospho-acceptor) domain [Gaiellaceae bacterium]|nr:His Kinase (phospho-acceptor) domain [Gaiellaceae bacterium]
MPASEDTSFARLVSLACHDLRTPLATISGFAKTLTRVEGVDDKIARYLGLMETASEQLGELLEELNVAARIAGGRYDPAHRQVDTLALAQAAAERVEGVEVTGQGGAVEVDVEAVERALAGFASCLRRHGPVEVVRIEVAGAELRLGPVTEAAAPVVLGEELRDLGSAVGRTVVEALGGSVEVADASLVVRLPG